MAENRFAKYKKQPENRFAKWAGKAQGAEPPQIRQEGISPFERIVLQNLFDTQPERRAAYLKSIGLEMDPEDSNRFRPLGSPEEAPYEGEIDPFLFDQIFSAESNLPGKKPSLLKETAQDVGDVAYDLGIAGPLTTVGALKGVAIGTPINPAIGAIMGVGGGAAGNVVAEEVKAGLGDLLLNENIPTDKKQMAFQSMLAGLATGLPAAFKAGKKFAAQKWIQSRTDAIENLIKAQGHISDEAIQKAVERPQLFTQEATKGANQRFLGLYKEFFGLDPEEDLAKKVAYLDGPPRESAIGRAMEPIRQARDTAIDQLATNPKAQMTLMEAKTPIYNEILELSAKINRTPQENEALSILKSQLTNLQKAAQKKAGKGVTDLDSVIFNFKEMNDFKHGLQGNAFKETAVGSLSENPIVGKVAGNFRQALDNKAVGSNYAELNSQLSEGLETFKQAASNLKPKQMMSAFVTGPGENALETKLLLSKIDKVTGGKFSQDFEDGALTSAFERFFEKPTPVGSSNVNRAITQQAAKDAAKGGAVGAGVGAMIPGIGPMAGAGIGSAIGGLRGAQFAAKYANPTIAVQELGRLGQKAAANQAASTIATPIETYLSQAVGRGGMYMNSMGQGGMSDKQLADYIQQQEELRRKKEEEEAGE